MSICRVCAKKLSWGNKSGLCQTHFNKDPIASAKRIAALKMAFKSRPELREAQRQHLVNLNRTPEARARSGRFAREIRLWEHGLPKVDQEVRQRAAKTLSERMLAHVPPEHLDLYIDLTKRKRLPASEALALVQEHAEAERERFRNRLEAA